MLKLYTAFLVLENGQMCQGWSFANFWPSFGEVVFNTGMTGYQEVVTDPSYFDQIILFTYPEIGNTGVNIIDLESNFFRIKGLIAKNICFNPSNWQTEISFPAYLVKYKIPHIFGLDTRSLTKQLRNKGVMMGCIVGNNYNSSLIQSRITKFKLRSEPHPVDKVSTRKTYKWLPKMSHGIYYKFFDTHHKSNILNVVVVDYGVKFNILNRLAFYGCNLTVVPPRDSYKFIVIQKPDGILLSNGPGDPSLIDDAVKNVRQIVDLNIPIFGVCLGHQLLSLAIGARTRKLKFGHRGLNHPSGAYSIAKITSQNHGYVVSTSNLSENIFNLSYLNLNDQTISGIVHKRKPCFSVQYHPEASPGPHDSDYLFAHFVEVMQSCKPT